MLIYVYKIRETIADNGAITHNSVAYYAIDRAFRGPRNFMNLNEQRDNSTAYFHVTRCSLTVSPLITVCKLTNILMASTCVPTVLQPPSQKTTV